MFIITAVGPDKPGMAHALAQMLFENDCNIEDTTMTRLSGQFAQILAVETPENLSLEALEARLAPLQSAHGLSIDVSPATDISNTKSETPRLILTAYGEEKTGLLAQLTGALARAEVNVTDVQTRVAAGGAVYVMLLELELPPNLSLEELEMRLVDETSDLQISLRPLDEETL